MARVTVVNDSSEFLDLMREILVGEGHEMQGHQAVNVTIDEILDTDPQLLIVDLRLEDRPQEISGWELLVLARSHGKLANVPVILCTGNTWEIEKRAADLERIAGVHVLTKPFHVDEMVTLIDRLLAEAPPGRPGGD
jgi:DNA-binding response OmpR family regulator